ncbi:CRAL-TRIO domain-containing protein C3H8.02-like [Pomacea canaliculata]|uniref:CRAL-TRIO domain-containing protein C3H8.02-like n=1 Tax=Pomacea canaliculata TaxID=400727 RepID=UPI000D72626D|nr:CRAL-TRIO domain-containing protein C3H8.02-like [Pomacea canaliculata]
MRHDDSVTELRNNILVTMAANDESPEDFEKFLELKERCKILFEADPSQAHSDASLKRFLRAFTDVDVAMKQLLKCNKWRREYGVDSLSPDDPDIAAEMTTGKVHILRNRDNKGRPVVYVAVRKHNAYERDIEKLKKFLVYILESACKKCNESVIDNLLLIFDMKGFTMACMDYQFVKNLIWILSRNYPERLGACLIINSPLIFSGCWTVVRPWLNDVTASKVIFLAGEKELCQYINPDALPPDEELGA